MVENIVITKQGSESSDPQRKIFDSTTNWSVTGSNLMVYKNGSLQEKNEDYSVRNISSIQLSSSASISDRISMVITKFLDPSGLTTLDQRMIDLDRVNKKIENKTQTSIEKREYEETIYSSFIIHKDEVWSSDIDQNPVIAEAAGVAFKRLNFNLTEDLTVSDSKGWYASVNSQLSGRIINWITPKFGHLYHIRIYDSNGAEIPSSSDINWKWDYQSGYLFIAKEHSHFTPFKVSGYIYTGSLGAGSLMYWKSPVQSFSVLPSNNNEDGDIRVVTSENKFYRWNSLEAEWQSIEYGSNKFKDPVDIEIDLPTTNNSDGDIRLILDVNILTRWNASLDEWQPITGLGIPGSNFYTKEEIDALLANKADDTHNHNSLYYNKIEVDTKVRWRPSRESQVDLPPYTENIDGDIILTRDDNTIWRWYAPDPNLNQGSWFPIITSNYWLTPVADFSSLPLSENKEGDVRLTLDNNNSYKWNNTEEKWILFSASTNWREPVELVVNLPLIDNRDKDIRFVNETKNFYYWDDATSIWNPLLSNEHSHDGTDSTKIDYNDLLNIPELYWGNPVASFVNLPAVDNAEGEARIVLDEKTIYVWNEGEWQQLTSSPSSHDHDDRYYTESEIDLKFDTSTGHDHDGTNSKRISFYDLLNVPASGTFKTPVETVANLPLTGNADGDIRIVFENSDIYEWNTNEWVLLGHLDFPTSDIWELPVNSFIDLPMEDNTDGAIRLILSENQLYRWDQLNEIWINLASVSSSVLAPGNIQVYLNGINLKQGEEWTVANGNTVIISEALVESDKISIVVINSSTIRRYNFDVFEGQTTFYLGVFYYRKDFICTETQSDFMIDIEYTPGENELIVWLNGQLLRVNEDFIELNETTIQFINPCIVDDKIIVIVLGYHIATGTYIREDHDSVLNQTDYTLLNRYIPGTGGLLVYLNGLLKEETEDYIELDADSVRMILPSDGDDRLTFIILEGIGIALNNACEISLGTPSDGSWSDGLLPFHQDYKTCDAIDDINEVLLDIVPGAPLSLMGLQLDSENLNLHSGYTSVGNVNYETFASDYHDYLTENSNFYLFTPEDAFSNADSGVLKLIVNGVDIDNFNLYNAFVENDSAENQGISYGILSEGARDNEGIAGTNGALRNSTLGYISIMGVGAYSGLALWQKGVARANIVTASLRQGYNYIRFVHEVDSEIRTSADIKFFYDISSSRPYAGASPVLVNSTINSNKYVSGVRYYSIGDEFTIDFQIYNAFSNTYVEFPVQLDMSGLMPKEIQYDHQDISGVSSPPENIDVIGMNTNIVLDEWNKYDINAILEIQNFDPFGQGPTVSTSLENRLVNTYTNGSTDLIEYFRDELHRMPIDNYDIIPASRINQWDSQSVLSSSDALLFNQMLIYANINFTSGYKPSPQTADYSGFSGQQVYYRCLYKGTARNSGKLIIRGITQDDLFNNKIIIDIKLPSESGWLSLNKYYDETTFDGVDGDGCFLNTTNTEEFNYSTGTLSTANSGFMMIIKVVLPDDTAPNIEYLEAIWD